MAKLESICSMNMGQSPDSASYNRAGEGLPFFQGNYDRSKGDQKRDHKGIGEVGGSAVMAKKRLGDINYYNGIVVNPLKSPDETYELYSVPSFDNGYPEIIKGSDIGSSKLIVEENDVLICKINPRINRVWVVKRNTKHPLLASSEWIVVRSHEIDSGYLKWYFSSPTFRELLVSQVTGIGGSLTRAQPKQVATYPVPIRLLNEQKKAAQTLDKVTELISLRKQQLAKQDELVKSQFIEMFGDEYEFGKWNCTTIENIANVTVGVVIKPAQYYTEEDNGVKAFRSLNVGEGYVRDGNWVYFTPEGHAANSKSMLQTGDVLVVRSGYPGTSCVVTDEYAGCNAIDIIITRPDINRINSVYLSAFNNLPHGQIQIKAKTGGAAQQHFNIGAYKAMTVPLPPMILQNRFAAFVQQIDKSKFEIQKSLEKLETLEKALMQQYFE